jgi:hypothetical protein
MRTMHLWVRVAHERQRRGPGEYRCKSVVVRRVALTDHNCVTCLISDQWRARTPCTKHYLMETAGTMWSAPDIQVHLPLHNNGELHHFLSICIVHNASIKLRTITFKSQDQYACDVLTYAHVQDAKLRLLCPPTTLSSHALRLPSFSSPLSVLSWLALVVTHVSILPSQSISSPSFTHITHVMALERVLCCLTGTTNKGITYSRMIKG